MEENNNFITVINSNKKVINLNLKEVLEYKDLIFIMVKKDFTALYKQTILGPAWAVIQPLFSTIIFSLIFGKLAGLAITDCASNAIMPSFLFYLAGNICWTYFSNNLTSTSNTFLNNAATMGKVYYPRLVAPISTSISQLISFLIQFVLFWIVWIYCFFTGQYSISITPWLLLVPFCILQMMMLSMGFGIIISSLTTKYRDLKYAIGFGIQLWQYASPVAYGLGMIPEKYTFIYLLNPISPVITTFRYAVFGFGYFNILNYLISWLVTICFFLLGIIMFNKVERTFMDTI